ncbi:MAG: electron transfer flavoprotein subunit alpha/FixB family protein [Candidatus Hodgkinia cicadicola]
MLARALVLPELIENKLSLDDQKLIRFGFSIARSVDILAFNCDLRLISAALSTSAATKIYIVSSHSPISKRLSSGALAMLLSGLCTDYDVVLASELGYFHDVLCRAGAVLSKPVVSSVYGLLEDDVFVRSVCTDRLTQHVTCSFAKPWLVSVRLSRVSTGRQPLPSSNSFQLLDFSFNSSLEVVSCTKLISSDSGRRLSEAQIVIAGGKSFGSAEAFSQYLVPLAAKLNAAVGATRAAVDAGYAPAEWQIGQTGQIITPKLYVAFGISGSSQHMMGVRGAQTVIAVNLNANAPIMSQADFGLVADMFEVIPKIIAKLSQV